MNNAEIADTLEKQARELMSLAAVLRGGEDPIREKAIAGTLTAKDVASMFMLSPTGLRHAVSRKGVRIGDGVRTWGGMVNVFGAQIPEIEIKKALGYKPAEESGGVLDDGDPIL